MSATTAKADIVASLRAALSSAPPEYPPDLPSRRELLGAPGWYPFEHSTWALGEHVRQALLAAPRLKTDPFILDLAAQVVECRNLRRGRQSFALLLGFKGASALAPRIAPFLADPDIQGQVLASLIKMRVSGYASEAHPLLAAKHAWIRTLAKRYLTRFPAALQHA